MNYLQSAGELALGSYMKMLSEMLYNSGDRIYRENNIPFQARWFPVFFAIHQDGPVSISDIANGLGLTHPAVSMLSKKLAAQGLVEDMKDREDERRRLLVLSPKGEALYAQMQPLWNDIFLAAKSLITRAAPDLMTNLHNLYQALSRENLETRVRKRLQARQQNMVIISEYRPQFKEDFKRLNIEWVEKYFYVEKVDNDILSNPEEYILQHGGYIFFALFNDEVIGTSALIRHPDGKFELSKMAVTEKYQGLKIGKRLADTAIEKVRSLGEPGLYLETNSKLKTAIALYKKLGFVQKDFPHGGSEHYQRADTYMELIFSEH